jgi:hypothetical protein
MGSAYKTCKTYRDRTYNDKTYKEYWDERSVSDAVGLFH